jgi:N-acetylneuraminate 9-O-acetyltransferase
MTEPKSSEKNDTNSNNNNNAMTTGVTDHSNSMTRSTSLWDILYKDWYGKNGRTFIGAQIQVVIVLVIAYIGNNWPISYPRNDNHNMFLFWFMNVSLLFAALYTMKHEPPIDPTNFKLQVLSRSQTEEWKGWMQWMFIMVRVWFMHLLNLGECFVIFLVSF